MSRKAYEMVPIWEKSNLSVDEAAAYTGIGTAKLREISDSESCDFVLWIGTKRVAKAQEVEGISGQCIFHLMKKDVVESK